MCTSLDCCSAVFGSPVTSRTLPTARPAPTALVPRLSVPLILLDTSGLLDPVPVISTAMANTLGCDTNHVGRLDKTYDDPARGQILGLDAARRRSVVHGDSTGPYFHSPCRREQGDLLAAVDEGVVHHGFGGYRGSCAQGALQSAAVELGSFRQIIIACAGDRARLYFYVIGREARAASGGVLQNQN